MHKCKYRSISLRTAVGILKNFLHPTNQLNSTCPANFKATPQIIKWKSSKKKNENLEKYKRWKQNKIK